MPVKILKDNDQSSNEEAELVICHRVQDLPIPHVPGDIQRCKDCNERIWVSFNSPKKPPKICIRCIKALIEKEKDPEGITVFMTKRHAGMFLGNPEDHPDIKELLEL